MVVLCDRGGTQIGKHYAMVVIEENNIRNHFFKETIYYEC